MKLSQRWYESNQRYLAESIEQIKIYLQRYIDGVKSENLTREWDEEHPPALETLCRLFDLSDFERSILLLCAGVELYSDFAKLCAKAQNTNNPYPTFGLALAALPNAHWSAITPVSPLRRFKLIELHNSQEPLVSRSMSIQERILHYITGISYLEPQLQETVKPVRESFPLTDSHKELVERILLSKDRVNVIQLWGRDENSKVTIAQNVCSKLGLSLWQTSIETIKVDDLDSFIHLWLRESILLGAGLYISVEEVEPAMQRKMTFLLDSIPTLLFIGTNEPWHLNNSISIEVKKPTKSEQSRLWRTYNVDPSLISRLVSQFDLNASSIKSVCREAISNDLASLWNASLSISRPRMLGLAQRIVSKASMDDLVLPEREKQLLKEIAIHVAHRVKVYEEWGFGSSNRGLGITALFAGPSGTGKTMAAEVLSNMLNLDLFRIDLSTVISKYIGETEKNLRKVFDAAEDSGAILFFDEADALFGKRTEVKDSHDRYANIEVNYLLQRMESYRGLAILATNMKNALDTAFIRRIRFIINFPFPDEKSREEIWKHIFPPSTPLDNIDIHRLSRLNISGGNIRNIAMNAAFLAAEEGVPINMKHLKHAAQIEYAKMERPFTKELD